MKYNNDPDVEYINADIEFVVDQWAAHVAYEYRQLFHGCPMGRGASPAAAIADLEQRAGVECGKKVSVLKAERLYQ